jgi:hypothetical protein
MSKDFSGQVERVSKSQPRMIEYNISLNDLRNAPKPGTRYEQVPKKKAKPNGRRPARMAQMLAFAHRLQNALDSGEVEDQAGLATRFGLTRTRVTRLLDLTLLAPDIQEEILFMESENGEEPISERTLKAIVREPSWEEQRKAWRQYRAQQN